MRVCVFFQEYVCNSIYQKVDAPSSNRDNRVIIMFDWKPFYLFFFISVFICFECIDDKKAAKIRTINALDI